MAMTCLVLSVIVIGQFFYIRWLKKEVCKRDKEYSITSKKEI